MLDIKLLKDYSHYFLRSMRLKDVKRLNKCEFGSEMFFRPLPFKITNFAIMSIRLIFLKQWVNLKNHLSLMLTISK